MRRSLLLLLACRETLFFHFSKNAAAVLIHAAKMDGEVKCTTAIVGATGTSCGTPSRSCGPPGPNVM